MFCHDLETYILNRRAVSLLQSVGICAKLREVAVQQVHTDELSILNWSANSVAR